MSDNDALLVSIENNIATLCLNRLKQRNALDQDLVLHLNEVLKKLSGDPQVRLIKIQANGPYFCAGGDLKWFHSAQSMTEKENIADASTLAELLRTLNEMPKPTLAIVQGPAFGGGLGIIACCDIAIAAESATFCLSEVKLGLVPATIAPYILQAIGARQARRYALSAETFSAAEAKQIGLIHKVVEEDKLQSTARSIATHCLNNGPKAMSATKKLIQDLSPHSENEFYKTIELLAKIRVSPEAQEGIKAFLEKRPPQWGV